MKSCVIIGGAEIHDYAFVREKLRADDCYIYCDSGLNHCSQLERKPDLIIGDFDSHANPHADIETIVLPTVKDDTDTIYAVKEALRRGYDSFKLVGVIGERMDHTLANVYALLYLEKRGARGIIIDDYSVMQIVGKKEVSISGEWSYFSLINITGAAQGITVTGAKYPLTDAVIESDYQYGVSNEVLPGHNATVKVYQGFLLLIMVR